MAIPDPYQDNIVNLNERLSAQAIPEPLKTGGSDGTFNGMEARVAKLEAGIEHIQRDATEIKTDIRGLRGEARTDFRLLFGALIFVALGLAGIMAKGFKWF
jgi:hypothetical protein